MRFAVFTIALLFASPSYAGAISVHDLVKICLSGGINGQSGSGGDQGFCEGYIQSVVDLYGASEKRICIRQDSLADTVVPYLLGQGPDKMETAASLVLAEILPRAFTCSASEFLNRF